MTILTAVGGQLLEITLALSVIIAALLLARPLLKKRYRAKAFYWIWLAAALRLVILWNPAPARVPVRISVPEVTLVQSRVESTALSGGLNAPGGTGAALPGAGTDLPAPENTRPAESAPELTLARLLTLLWLAGMAGFLGWNALTYARFRRRVRRWKSPEADPAILARFEALREAAGAKGLTLARCAAVSSPLITGFVHTELLLPDWDFSPDALDAVFRHELIHARRHDLWYKLLLLLARGVHWFNPLVHLMARQAERDLELSCDEAALAGQDAAFRSTYGRAILSAAEKGLRRDAPLTSCFHGGKAALLERLKAIVNEGGRRRRGIALACALALLVAAGAAACSVAGDTTEDTAGDITNDTARDTTEEVITEQGTLIGYDGPVRWDLGKEYAIELYNAEDGVLTFRMVFEDDTETVYVPFQRLPSDYGADLRYPYPSSVSARPFQNVLGQEGFVLTYGLGLSSVAVEYYCGPDLLLACDGMVYEVDVNADGDAEVLEIPYGLSRDCRLYRWESGEGVVTAAELNRLAAQKLDTGLESVELEYLEPERGYRAGDPLTFRCTPRMNDAGRFEETTVSLRWEDLTFALPSSSAPGTAAP